MNDTRRDIERALAGLARRLDELDAELLRLGVADAADSSITRWPAALAKDLERIMDERDGVIAQAATLRRLLA